eukprot:366476-Chlamydomonas_euryale.AAC.7
MASAFPRTSFWRPAPLHRRIWCLQNGEPRAGRTLDKGAAAKFDGEHVVFPLGVPPAAASALRRRVRAVAPTAPLQPPQMHPTQPPQSTQARRDGTPCPVAAAAAAAAAGHVAEQHRRWGQRRRQRHAVLAWQTAAVPRAVDGAAVVGSAPPAAQLATAGWLHTLLPPRQSP